MKKSLGLIAFFFCIFCSFMGYQNHEKNFKTQVSKKLPVQDSLIYLKKLSLTGDFDGDGKQDTIYQDVISEITHQPINSYPNSIWEIEDLEKHFSKIGADIILTMKNQKCDTLHLGSGCGLYCLINIGDNNNDKKDEIAFVADYYDESNISPCSINTLCDGKWIELKSFKIFESAFYFTGETIPEFKQIEGFLEFRKNKWHYIDYMDWWSAKTDKDTILKPLKIKKGCK